MNTKEYQHPASYLRVSSDKQDVDRQKSSHAEFYSRTGLKPFATYEDSEGMNSRHKAESKNQRLDFKRMMADAEAGVIDCIVVDQVDRFGTSGPQQWTKYIGNLQDWGVDLIDVSGKVWTATDDGTAITGFVYALQSKKEQFDKSWRGLSGKVLKAAAGHYQGGNPPYGTDVVCFGADGNEKWRCVYEGHYKRVKFWADGRTERFDGKDNSPKKDATDILRIRPSVHQQRIETVKQVFEWFTTEEISPGKIAERLNKLGVPSVFSPLWYKHSVDSILHNPCYLGRFVWNKIGKSEFTEYVGGKQSEVAKVRGKVKLNRRRDSKDFIVSNNQEFEPFITKETFDLAQSKMGKSGQGSAKRGPSDASLWLRGLLVCGKCGKPMYSQPANGGNKGGYCCSTYVRYRRINPTGCKCHRILHEPVEKAVMEWVSKFAPEALDSIKSGGDASKLTEAHQAKITELLMFAEGYSVDMMEFVDQAGGGDYKVALEKVRPKVEAKIAAKEEEMDAAVDGWSSLPEVARPRAKKKLEAMEAEIAAMRNSLCDIDSLRTGYVDDIEKLKADFAKAKREVEGTENGRQKSSAIGRIVDRVICNFEYKGSAERSQLASITVIPRDSSTARCDNAENEVPIQRNFVFSILEITVFPQFSAERPTRRGLKHHSHVGAERKREQGRQAAQVRIDKARREGRPNSLTPEQRSELAKKAAAARVAKAKARGSWDKLTPEQRSENAKRASALGKIARWGGRVKKAE